jgi:hypothetical protein
MNVDSSLQLTVQFCVIKITKEDEEERSRNTYHVFVFNEIEIKGGFLLTQFFFERVAEVGDTP